MRTTATVCSDCGVTTADRDYMPTTYVIQLFSDVKSTYVLTPSVEAFLKSLPFCKIRSIDADKRIYAFDTPLQGKEAMQLWKLLDADCRIKAWHTVVLHSPDGGNTDAALVCERQHNFINYLAKKATTRYRISTVVK